MAKKVTVTLEDDISGDVIDEALGGGTLALIWEGKPYLIDLGTKNVAKYVKPLLDHAREPSAAEREERFRKAGSRRGPAPKARSAVHYEQRSSEANQDIRAWAKRNGLTVSPRGRISAEVVAKYDEAHR